MRGTPAASACRLKRTVIVSGCGAGRPPSRTAARGPGSAHRERALGVEHVHVGAQYPECVGVERDGAPTVVGLAVLLDYLAERSKLLCLDTGARAGSLKRSLRRVRRLGHGERPGESVKTRCDRIFRAGGPVVCSPVGQLDGEIVDRARGVIVVSRPTVADGASSTSSAAPPMLIPCGQLNGEGAARSGRRGDGQSST